MRKVWLIGMMVVVLGIVGYYVFFRDTSNVTIESTPVVRVTVQHVVNVAGHVEPLERLELGFGQGGILGSITVREGDTVAEGEFLASLDAGVVAAGIREASARELRERALLTELIAPARDAEVAVKTATVSQAEATLAQAELAAKTTIARAYVQAEDAISEKIDELFSRSAGGSFSFGLRFEYGTTDYILRADNVTRAALDTGRARVANELATLEGYAEGSVSDVGAALHNTRQALQYIEQFTTDVAQAINRYTPTDSDAQTVYAAFQSKVATARTSVSAARSDVVAAETALVSAQTALTAAERAVDLVRAEPKDASVAVQEASILAAAEARSGATASLRMTRVHAPMSGVVSRVLHDRGETVAPYEPVVEVITPNAFELEAYIPEADIARVKLGDRATVTFDAFGKNDVFEAEVLRIAVSETMREGVPTYKTTLILLTEANEELVLRSGMTADIDILTAVRDDVLAVPTRSIFSRGDEQYVRVLVEDSFEERVVEVGLRGSEGMTEILNGIKETDDIVIFIDEE